MKNSWLDQLEKNLSKKLETFLNENPYQESLLQEQAQKDLFRTLHLKQDLLKNEAKKYRNELLQLAKEIKEWTNRASRARRAGAKELADKASAHIEVLMKNGRDIWSELDHLGIQFNEINQQIIAISHDSKKEGSNLEQDWATFEANEELDHLRKKNGLKE